MCCLFILLLTLRLRVVSINIFVDIILDRCQQFWVQVTESKTDLYLWGVADTQFTSKKTVVSKFGIFLENPLTGLTVQYPVHVPVFNIFERYYITKG